MQNNRPTPSPTPIRWLLAILGIALVVGAAIFSIFYFGVFKHSGPVANSTPTPITQPGGGGGPCTTSSPYGFTTIHADAQLVTFYKQLNVCWVRYQIHWRKQGAKAGIETSPGVYDWSQVDAAVAAMNAAHIHIDFAIQYAPQWDLTQTCAGDGKPFLPGPDQMRQFATILATRYNGKNGHGFIDSYEIGNEEYDSYFVPSEGNNQECRNANYYAPVLKAGYEAIKAVSPQALVGMFGMWWHYEPHIRDFITYLFTNGYGKYMDYMNFHYYHGGEDPSVTDGDNPSFDLQWQTMHNIAAQYGFANKPIWVTETGWPSADAQKQNQYLQYIMGESAKSHVIQKVFWFTINYGQQADNIYPAGGSPMPAFFSFQAIVRQKPQWG